MLFYVPNDQWLVRGITLGAREVFPCAEILTYDNQSNLASSDWRRGRAAENQRLLNEFRSRLARTGKRVFVACYDEFLATQTIQRLREMGAVVINFHENPSWDWPRVYRNARYFHVQCMTQRRGWHELERTGATLFFFPNADNPTSPLLADTDYETRQGVLLDGSYNGFRGQVYRAIREVTDKIHVMGARWKSDVQAPTLHKGWHLADMLNTLRITPLRARTAGWMDIVQETADRLRGKGTYDASAVRPTDIPRLTSQWRYEDYPTFFQSAAICVGTGYTLGRWDRDGRCKFLHVRQRDFEVPMHGGFLLAQDSPEIHEHYVVGKEIDTWRTFAELQDKVRHYLANPDEAWRIAKAGQARARAEHTWAARFRRLEAFLNTRGL